MRHRFSTSLLVGGMFPSLVFLLIGATIAAAGDPARKAPPAADRAERIKQRDALWAEARRLQGQGKLPEAIAATERMLVIERKVLGKTEPGEIVVSLAYLAGLHESREDFAAADGILTAEEIGTMNLDGAGLVILCACETGLGQTAGGEGLLGLQRAFPSAGARAVVASLWNVPDDETRTLMEEFYTNLWQRKLSPLESLRRAQLEMLARPIRPGQQRGYQRLDGAAATSSGKRSPYFWAAFVLSGDWRKLTVQA